MSSRYKLSIFRFSLQLALKLRFQIDKVAEMAFKAAANELTKKMCEVAASSAELQAGGFLPHHELMGKIDELYGKLKLEIEQELDWSPANWRDPLAWFFELAEALKLKKLKVAFDMQLRSWAVKQFFMMSFVVGYEN